MTRHPDSLPPRKGPDPLRPDDSDVSGGQRLDVHGPKIAHHIFEPESLDPEDTGVVMQVVGTDPDLQAWADELRELGRLSDRALPGRLTRDLTGDIVSQFRQTPPRERRQPADAAPTRKDQPMGIRFLCGSCTKKYEVAAQFAGRRMKCTRCGEVLTVPDESTIGRHGSEPATTSHTDTATGEVEAPRRASSSVLPSGTAMGAPPQTDSAPGSGPVGEGDATDPFGFVRDLEADRRDELDPERTVMAGHAPVDDDETDAAMDAVQPARRRARSDARSPQPDARRASSPVSRQAGGSGRPGGSRRGQPAGRSSRSAAMMAGQASLRQYRFQIIAGATVLLIIGLIAILLLSGPSDPVADPDLLVGGEPTRNNTPSGPVVVPHDPRLGEAANGNTRPDSPTVRRDVTIEAGFPEFGQQWEEVSIRLAASGGIAPYRWRLGAGSQLPDGLTLEDDVVTGMCREPGEYTFTLECIDARGNRARTETTWVCDPHFEIDVAAHPPDVTFGDNLDVTFRARGGVQPYTFGHSGLNLPRGVEWLPGQATIRGTANDRPGRYSIRLQVTDARGRVDEVRFRFFVRDPQPVLVSRPPEFAPPPELDRVRPMDDPDAPRRRPLERDPSDHGEIVGWQAQQRNNTEVAQINREAVLLMQDTSYPEAENKLFEALDLDGGNTMTLYNLACLYSLWGQGEHAWTALSTAIHYGYTNWDHINADPDLEFLRSQERFRLELPDRNAVLDLAAAGIEEAVQQQFPDYETRIDREHRLVFATNQSPEVLQLLQDRMLTYAESQNRVLFEGKADYYILVVLPSMRDYVEVRPAPNIGGWYSPNRRMLICSTVGKTLTHEFTHALHFADLSSKGLMWMQQIWFLEGLATLYEDSKLPQSASEVAVPVHNTRLAHCQAAIRSGVAPDWDTYLRWGQSTFMDGHARTMMCYGMARYVTWWIHEQGKLKEFYDAYCETCNDGSDEGRAGIKAMEQTFGRPLATLEAEWREWVMALDPPAAESNAWLGVAFDRTPLSTGLRVQRVLAGSPAERAGIEVGDIIVECDSRPVDDERNLIQTLSEFQPGDVVRLVIVREGERGEDGRPKIETETVAVLLGAKDGDNGGGRRGGRGRR